VSAFGKIVVATQIEYAIRDLLKLYFPMYLREIERIMSWEREELPTPRNYTNRNTFDALPGEELPKVVVISPGLLEPPERVTGDGDYRATWQVGVGVAIAARTEEEADFQVKMYAAAVRGIVLHNKSMGRDDIVGVYWLDENYDDLPIDDQHANYKAAGNFFGVEVEGTINTFMRPPLITEAAQELGEIEKVIVTFPEVPHEVVTEEE